MFQVSFLIPKSRRTWNGWTWMISLFTTSVSWQENKGSLLTCSTAISSLSGCYKSLHSYKYHCFLSWGLALWVSWLRICLRCGRPEFNPWVGKIPWKREKLPTPVFWPGQFHGLYSSWGHKESDTTDFHFLRSWPVHVLGLCAFKVGNKFKLKFLGFFWGVGQAGRAVLGLSCRTWGLPLRCAGTSLVSALGLSSCDSPA